VEPASPPQADLHQQPFRTLSYQGAEGLATNFQARQQFIFPSSKISGEQQKVFKDNMKF